MLVVVKSVGETVKKPYHSVDYKQKFLAEGTKEFNL